jgi:type IV secretion system protein VirB6
MMLVCPAPDSSAGIAVRLSEYMDCQARALGENGFQALAGGPVGASVLSGLLTIFVGLIGYRLILGGTPGIRDGIGWMVRVGFVLALVTSWPAFQTLVFRVAVDGPGEVAGIVLPASGLPSDSLDRRVQQAYDTIRLGSTFQPNENPQAQNPQAAQGQGTQPSPPALQASMYQSALPQTASLFVLSTSGFTGAFRIAIGFLLAVAPLALMALLFDATLGIFIGWMRALTGMAFASLATTIVTATHLMAVEGELGHLQALRLGGAVRTVDPQGLTTIVLIFALVMLVASFAAIRTASAFRMGGRSMPGVFGTGRASAELRESAAAALRPAPEVIAIRGSSPEQARVAGVAQALTATVRREEAAAIGGRRPFGVSQSGHAETMAIGAAATAGRGLGSASRRTVSRHTRSAARRDRMG